jgi:hypothetical protein
MDAFYMHQEYILDMLYDNALDDGPTILEYPPSLAIDSDSCEDKDDALVVYYDTHS